MQCAINWAQAGQKTMCYVLKSTHLLFFCCSSLHASGLSVFLAHSPNLSQNHASAVSSVRRWTRRCWAVKSVRPYWAVSKVWDAAGRNKLCFELPTTCAASPQMSREQQPDRGGELKWRRQNTRCCFVGSRVESGVDAGRRNSLWVHTTHSCECTQRNTQSCSGESWQRWLSFKSPNSQHTSVPFPYIWSFHSFHYATFLTLCFLSFSCLARNYKIVSIRK